MNKRLFTFGCSFTRWKWPTWSDYIGINFDEYYNAGQAGSDNKHILNQLLLVDKKYNFTPDDYVMIMFTSFNRMTYVDDKFKTHCIGDLVDDNLKLHPMGNRYNFPTAVLDSCISIRAVKSILDSKKIKYTFLQSLEYDFLVEEKVEGEIKDNLKYCLGLMKYPIMDTWCDSEGIIWKDTNIQDSHPTLEQHFDYVKEFFPQFITDKSIEYYDYCKKNFTNESPEEQEKKFHKIQSKFFREGYDIKIN